MPDFDHGPSALDNGPSAEQWLEVARDRLLGQLGSLPTARLRRRRMLDALSLRSRAARAEDGNIDADPVALLRLIGFDDGEHEGLARELSSLIRAGAAAGVDSEALPHVAQAYVRAIGRIVAVEALVMREALGEIEADQREATIGGLIDALLPVSNRGFDVLHRVMLHEALVEASHGLDPEQDAPPVTAIGMVDLVRSTAYLGSAGAADLEHLVDAIFAAGQQATSERTAHIVKYVGDGAFIAATDVVNVADTALAMIGQLEDEVPLRARGGISCGFVVQRAGDVFGMPVNMAQALTKAARPGSVLLSAEAAGLLPRERRGRLRWLRLPHAALGEQRVATLRASPPNER
jgi:adenylate cyclase